MLNLRGEYECRLDSKNRVSLPSALQRQLPPEAESSFVINRGFEKHLVLYPRNIWEVISAEINRLSPYVKKHREFARYFYRGASDLRLDSHSRLLLPKQLLEYAEIKSDIKLFAYSNKIEVWSKELYDRMLLDEPKDFSQLAEEVMGGLDPDGEPKWRH